jgi:hypothetical protein
MATFTEQILDHLEPGSPLSSHTNHSIDFDHVRRILLRDNQWHFVYKPTEADREELAKTLVHVRRKCDALCKGKTDAEVVEAMPGYFPGRQHPARLAAKPFRSILVQGERWAMWPEGQDPIPSLMQIMVPWREIMALEVDEQR